MPRRLLTGRTQRCLASLALVASMSAREAVAGPDGEERTITRDTNRPYTVVAGEADASAVVQNAANLGYLRGLNGVFDFSVDTQRANLRGSGVGAFLALPLPFQILSLGVGVQHFWRGEQGDENEEYDAPFGKFTFAAAVPLERWARGLSVGLDVNAYYTRRNALLQEGATSVGAGIAWRANRFVTLGMALRNFNAMRFINNNPDSTVEGEDPAYERASPVLDPELALRPFGTPWLEFGFGMRFEPWAVSGPDASYVRTPAVLPRGRILAGYNGVRAYVEAERMAFRRSETADFGEDALRINVGLQFDTPHLGMSAGGNFAVGTTPVSGGTGGHGRIRISQEAYQDKVEIKPRKVMRLDVSKYKGERGTARLVYQIDELTRLGAGAMLLDARDGANTYAQLEEIREAILRFRGRGGKVAAFIDGASTREYFLVSVADRIYAQPGGQLSILGVRLSARYWGELLKNLGIKSDFVRIAEYKGSAETYDLDTASEPVASQRDLLLMDAWNHLVRSIAEERGLQSRELVKAINAAPLTPEKGLELGLVDELVYPDQLDEGLERWLRRKVRIDSPSKRPKRPGEWGKQAHVAVLYVAGDLVPGKSAVLPILGNRLAGAETLTAEIRRLRKDPNVRAVVVRVASRGGSVDAAKSIAHELDLTREVKPVIMSFGSVAASGGYWIATAGDFIYADAMTTTGSIGIFYPKMDLSDFLDRYGVGVDLVGYGARAHLRSWFKPYNDDERAAAQASIQYSYDEFVARVAKARSMTPEEVDEVARGRVWSGVRAIDRGLVDAYGGLREAIVRARRVAELSSRAPAYAYPRPPGLLEQVQTLFGLKIPRLASASYDPATDGLDATPGGGRGRVLAGSRVVAPEFKAMPLMRLLAQIPPSLWLLDAPEAMALTEWDPEID